MNISFTSKQFGLSAACALALSFALSSAQAADFESGATIWRNTNAEVGAGTAGEWCWNRAFGPQTPPNGCEHLAVDKNVTPAPVAVFAAPAPAPVSVSVQAQYVEPARAQPTPAAAPSERPAKPDRN